MVAAISSIEAKLLPFRELEAKAKMLYVRVVSELRRLLQMQYRATLKIDFDAYTRKMEVLKEKGAQADPEKLRKTEMKLVRTLASLFDCTQDIYTMFRYYEELGVYSCGEVLQHTYA
jgi:hypothetical protein